MAQSSPSSKPPRRPLVEGVDYYLENGLFVLTEHFLRERGYCCGSGCRYCPYDKQTGELKEERP